MKRFKYLVLITAIGSVLMGCKKDEDLPGRGENFDEAALLKNVSEQIIYPKYEALRMSSEEFHGAVEVFSTDLDIESLTQVQEELAGMYTAYQGVSSFDFGPASDVGFRAIANTYPVNQSIIESNVNSGSYNLEAAGNLAANGLPALDYLLMNGDQQSILDAFTTGANHAQRLTYLQDVSTQMQQLTAIIAEEWGGAYGATFRQNTGTGVGSSISNYINAMVQDFERYTRDGKVGIPVGVRSLGVTHPDKVEAYYGGISNELLVTNLTELMDNFKGGSGPGLDDYLAYNDANVVSADIIQILESAVVKTNALSSPMSVAVDQEKVAVEGVYEELQKALVKLKVDMPSALSVLITYQDSDGD